MGDVSGGGVHQGSTHGPRFIGTLTGAQRTIPVDLFRWSHEAPRYSFWPLHKWNNNEGNYDVGKKGGYPSKKEAELDDEKQRIGHEFCVLSFHPVPL